MTEPSSTLTDSHGPPPSRKMTRQQVITVTAALAALLMAAAALVVALTKPWQRDTVDHYIEQSGIANKETLKIGVFDDVPLNGIRVHPEREDANQPKDFTGFDIDIALALARYLGYIEESVRLVPTDPPDRAAYLAEGKVDIVVANFSMTDDREDLVDFAGPYMVSRLAVMVRKQSPAPPEAFAFDKLSTMGRKLCTTESSTAETALREENVTNFVTRATHEECTSGVLAGEYDAFMLDEVILAGYTSLHKEQLTLAKLVTDRFERYGIAVANGDFHLRQVIGNFLLDSHERGTDGAWQRAWARSLGKELKDRSQPRPEDVVKLRDYQDQYQAAAPPGGPPRDLLTCPSWSLRPRS